MNQNDTMCFDWRDEDFHTFILRLIVVIVIILPVLVRPRPHIAHRSHWPTHTLSDADHLPAIFVPQFFSQLLLTGEVGIHRPVDVLLHALLKLLPF